MSKFDAGRCLDILPQMVFETDSEMRLIYTNPFAAVLLGYEPEEFRAMRLPELFVESDRDTLERILEESMQGTLPLDMQYSLGALRKDGQTLQVGLFLSAANDGGRGVVGLLVDQTEYAAMNTERNQLAAAIDQAGDMVVTTDADGNIEYVNPAFERITQYSMNEVIGRNPRILKSGRQDESYYRNLWSTINEGKIWRGEFINRRKDGSLYQEAATISPILDKYGQVVKFVSIKRDMSAFEDLQRKLRQSQKMEALGRMAAVVAHDFNNILQIMNGYSQLAMEESDPESSLYSYVEKVLDGGRRARALIDKLARFSNTEVRELERVEIDMLIERIEDTLQELVDKDHRIEVSCNAPRAVAMAEEHALENVISNLCTNARDAMPDGGEICIRTGLVDMDQDFEGAGENLAPGEYIYIEVEDNGTGIDPSIVEKVFDPFFTTKRKGEGTGLGLATIYSTIDNYDGFVDLETEPGRGSLFTIYLPLAEASQEQARQDDGEGPSISVRKRIAKGAEVTILMAEDEDMVRNFTSGALRQNGYRVIEACNGEEAIDLYDKYRDRIDIALLDMVMPVKQGSDVRNHIHSVDQGLPVIFITGYSEAHTDIDFNNLPGNERILYKPCDISDIIDAIQQLVEQD